MKKTFTIAATGACLFAALLQIPSPGLAQDTHTHQTTALDTQATGIIKAIRDSTAKYKDVSAAIADGYALQFGCVSGSDSGAMGLHYVNAALVNSGVLDPAHPQIVIYEAMPDGTLQLTGADFLVIADAWNSTHLGPPQLMGQLFHLFDAPNR